MSIRVWRRRKPAEQEDVGAECEAFLQGSYVEYLTAVDRPIPSWAWLNALAHGTAPEIEALARGTSASEARAARGTEWYAVVAFLASEALLVARTSGDSVTEIQQAVLVDVELSLAEGSGPYSLLPRALVEHTLTSLHRYRIDRRSRPARRSQRRG